MSSMSNVEYTAQSMNGIITLSDGMGTIIENGSITTNTINVGNITSPSITALIGNVLVLQSNIVNTTTQINNLYGNVSVVQSQIPPIYGNVLVLQSNIVNTTTQINNLYGNVSVVQSQIPPLYGNVLVLQGNIVNTTTQINNLYGNISVVQSQIPPLYGNVLDLQTKTTAISYIPTTTTISSNVSIQGNVITNGQIDVSNIAVSGFGAVSNTFAVGEDLGVGNNIVHSGNIITGKSQISNTVITNNLLVNGTVINGNSQTQLDFLYNNLFQQRFRPVFNSIDPSGLQLYYPFTSSKFFNLTTKHEDGIRIGNLATGVLVYDASLTGLTKIDDTNRLATTHTASLPVGQHGLVINRTVGATPFSICFWFICTSLPSADYWFFTTFQNNTGSTRFYMTIDPQNKIRIAGNTGNTVLSTGVVIVNTRYFIVYTSNTFSNGLLYINGILNAVEPSPPQLSPNNSGFNIIMRDPLGNGLIGNIDDYRFYGRVITQTEINTLYSVPPY